MADVTIDPSSYALLLQDLQNELLKGDRPVVPLNGEQLINIIKLLERHLKFFK